MAVYTLTQASPESADFTLAADGDIEVVIARESNWVPSNVKVSIKMETTTNNFITIPQTEFTRPDKGTYSFKAGKFRFRLEGASAETSVTLSVK